MRTWTNTHLAGMSTWGMAPIEIKALPNMYTMDRYKMVLNRPSQLSAMRAPTMGNI